MYKNFLKGGAPAPLDPPLRTVWLYKGVKLAGHAFRSKTRFKSLDKTALIAVACRHEYPKDAYSLHHGEQYANLHKIMCTALI